MKESRAMRAVLVAAVALALMVVAGCGSSGNGGGTSGGSATSGGSSTSGGGGAPGVNLGTNKNVVWQRVGGPFSRPVLSGGSYTLDVGNGHTLTWRKGQQLHIAAFEYASNNTYQTAHIQAVKDAAKAVGATVQIFDAQANPATQRSQIQNALASRQFNAAIIQPIASQPSCQQITNDIPAANIPVIVASQETCGRDAKSGQDLWSPGIVSWVGNDWTAMDLGWAKAVSDDLGKPTDTLWVGGPSDNIVASLNARVLRAHAADHPNLKLVDFAYTDYTPAAALTQVQNLLKAHPSTGAIVMQFGGLIPGVSQAVKQAGAVGRIKLYSIGGTQQDKPAIASGLETFTVPFYPYTQAFCSVEMLAALNAGMPVPHVVVNDCNVTNGSPDTQNTTTITKSNVGSFTPQG